MFDACVYLAAVGLPDAVVDDVGAALYLQDLKVLLVADLLVEVEIVEMHDLAIRCHLEILLALSLLRGGNGY